MFGDMMLSGELTNNAGSNGPSKVPLSVSINMTKNRGNIKKNGFFAVMAIRLFPSPLNNQIRFIHALILSQIILD